MSSTNAPVPMETLLTHRDWVRRLARSLVQDQASADDVEQRTWLEVLRNPPRHEGTARAWLARVVRSQVLDAFRARGRREVHERAAMRPAAPRSPADVVAEADAHRRLVVAVQDLAEPYRTTVLLRWFEDLPPRTVAERMGVPVETVRTRLRRSHDTLREELDRAAGDSGWIAVLVPLTGLRPEAAAGPSMIAATKAAGTFGGAVMGTKTAVAVGVAVAASFVGGTIVGRHGDMAGVAGPELEVAALRARLEAVETARSRTTERQPSPSADRRIDGLQEVVAAQSGRLDTIEASLATVARDVTAVAAVTTGRRAADTASPARDAVAELQRLQGLTDDDVFQAIREMMSAGTRGGTTDGKAVVEACELLLARTLAPSKRAEALTYKGIGHRILRERSNEEAAFRDAVAAAGSGSKEAREATHQLAWTAANNNDHRGSAEMFIGLARDPSATLPQRSANRINAAMQFEQAADKDRAVTEYRAVVEEFGNCDDASARAVAERARVALERLARAAAPVR